MTATQDEPWKTRAREVAEARLGKRAWNILSATGQVVREFIDNEGLTRAAAVSYYTALSFAPLILLLLTVISWFSIGGQQRLVDEISSLVGTQAAELAELVIQNADKEAQTSRGASWFGLGALLFSAAAVFGQLQRSLNHVWSVEATPSSGVLSWILSRMVSMGMVVAVAFLLTVSLAISAALSFLRQYSMEILGDVWAWEALSNLVSFAILTTLFAGMFRVLPDVRLRWRDVWLGGAATSVLFVIGKWGVAMLAPRHTSLRMT